MDAQIEYLRVESRVGGYEIKDRHRSELDKTYESVASLLGAGVDEIALTSNATESWELAFGTFRFDPGDRILTAAAEYASNYIVYLQAQQRHGVSVEVIPNDEYGQTDPTALSDMLDERVKLVSLSHMPTNGGLINPAAEIGAVTRAAGIPFLLDACQTVGQLDLDVHELGCDLLTATGRKYLRGPRGTGILYVGRPFLDRSEPPFLDLHGAEWADAQTFTMRQDARRYETWEFNYAAIIGLGVATEYAQQIGMSDIENRVIQLAGHLRSELSSLPTVTVWDTGARQGGIVTFSHQEIDAADLVDRLYDLSVNTSVTTPASTRIDATQRSLPDMVRASVHYYNTDDEISRFVGQVRALSM